MRTLALVLVAACAGATPATLTPASRDGPPGTRWITPVEPWHLTDGAGGVIVAGNIALVAGTTFGVIEKIDLTTGARVDEHALGKPLRTTSFVRMSDGRYLLAGEHDDATQVAILDPATLAPTWFTFDRITPEKDSYASPSALELADHSIVVAGIDLPLALYDATTMKRTRMIQEQASWSDLAVTKTAIFARRQMSSMRFDLETSKTSTPATSMMAAAGDVVVERTYEKGEVKFRIVNGTTTRELPSTLGFTASLDSTGARLASVRTGVVTVYSTTDASVLARFDLAPQTLWGGKLVFAGDRLVIASGSTIRVADLATKALTSIPEPYGHYLAMAVDDAGSVTAIGSEVWRYVDGKRASTASLGKQTALVSGTPLAHFATRTSRPFEPGLDRRKFPSVIAVKTLEGRSVREWTLPRETDSAWIGANGRIVASYKWEVDSPQKIVVSNGTKIRDVIAYNTDAMIDDVDVDGNVAAVSLGGTATLVDLVTGKKTHEIYNPNCAEYGSAEFEPGGARVVTTDDKDAIVWDRATGKAIRSARFPDTIYNTTFIPGESSLLVRLIDRMVVWDPTTNTTRTLAYRDAIQIHVSPNKRHAALALRDGRLVLADFAALRAAMTPGPTVEKVDVPVTCSPRDPFDLRDPAAPKDDQTGDIDEDHVDEDVDDGDEDEND